MYQIFNKLKGTAIMRRPKEPLQFYSYGDALHWLNDNNIDPALWEIRKVDD